MLDLVEGAKIICGVQPTTGTASSALYSDWINCENYHRVWAICTRGTGTGADTKEFSANVAESYAGASAQKIAATYWNSTQLALDRLMKSTNTTGALSGTTGGMVVILYDPSVADSSDKYFAVGMTSAGPYSVTYICEPRYAGYQATLGTTSST